MIKRLFTAGAFAAAVLVTAIHPASAQVMFNLHVGPPAPVYEPVPPPPGVDLVWVPGYWGWNGGRYVWFRGRYVHRPYAGARWVPDRWHHGPHGYVHDRGYWAR